MCNEIILKYCKSTNSVMNSIRENVINSPLTMGVGLKWSLNYILTAFSPLTIQKLVRFGS